MFRSVKPIQFRIPVFGNLTNYKIEVTLSVITYLSVGSYFLVCNPHSFAFTRLASSRLKTIQSNCHEVFFLPLPYVLGLSS